MGRNRRGSSREFQNETFATDMEEEGGRDISRAAHTGPWPRSSGQAAGDREDSERGGEGKLHEYYNGTFSGLLREPAQLMSAKCMHGSHCPGRFGTVRSFRTTVLAEWTCDDSASENTSARTTYNAHAPQGFLEGS